MTTRLLHLVAALGLVASIAIPVGMAFVGDDPAGPRADTVRGGDLVAFWVGAKILDEGRDGALYERRRSGHHQRTVWPETKRGYRLVYPPPVYQLSRIGSSVDYFGAVKATLVALGLLAILAVVALVRVGPKLGPEWVAVGLLAGSPALLSSHGTGQLGALWVLFVFVGIALLLRGRLVWAGLVLGLCCAKPTVAAAVGATLLLTGRRRALVGFGLGALALFAASVAVDGLEPWRAWWTMQSDAGHVAHKMWIQPHRHLTVRALVALAADKTAWEDALGGIGVLLGLGFLGWVAWATRRGGATLLHLGAVLVAALIAQPHLFEYDAGLFAPAWLASAALLVSGRAVAPRAGMALVAASWIAPVLWPLSQRVPFSFGTAIVVAWVVWMIREIRAARPLVDSAAP